MLNKVKFHRKLQFNKQRLKANYESLYT